MTIESMAEIEKPFKCCICNDHFTNDDHLQVHKRRHEMSLNLMRPSASGQQEHFIDETPTPTRFIANCEELGLFDSFEHDVESRNRNPFDETFRRASRDPCSISRHFNSDQESLHTPQIAGDSTTSTPVSTTPTSATIVLTPTPRSKKALKKQESKVIDEEEEKQSRDQTVQNSNITTTTLTASIPFPTKENFSGLNSSIIPQLNIRIVSVDSLYETEECIPLNENVSQCQEELIIDLPQEETVTANKEKRESPKDKQQELRDRNRQAASRLRERKRLLEANLQKRCENAEKCLTASQKEVIQLRQKVELLQEEIALHANCDVTLSRQSGGIITSPGLPRILPIQQHQRPHILRQSSSTPTSPTKVIILEDHRKIEPKTSALEVEEVVSPQKNVIIKPRRGRPRKGQEKRVSVMDLEINSTPSTVTLKFPISPCQK